MWGIYKLAAENIYSCTSGCFRDGYDDRKIPVAFQNCIMGEAAYYYHDTEHWWYVYTIKGRPKYEIYRQNRIGCKYESWDTLQISSQHLHAFPNRKQFLK